MTGLPPLSQPIPEEFAPALQSRANRLAGFARRVSWYDTVGSTNDVADRLAAADAEHGTVVAAGGQESGRGRQGRSWFSPPDAGLYVSVVLRPSSLGRQAEGAGSGLLGRGTSRPDNAHLASSVTLTAGVALAEALREVTALPIEIKWPNDLVLERRKLCGILAEAAALRGEVQHIILGFGINLRPAAYPPDIAHRATSLETELGRAVDRGEVFAEALACLAERFRELADGGFYAILDCWRHLSPTCRGASVEISTPFGSRAGRTAGVDDDGALLVRIGDATERVIAGEVRWI